MPALRSHKNTSSKPRSRPQLPLMERSRGMRDFSTASSRSRNAMPPPPSRRAAGAAALRSTSATPESFPSVAYGAGAKRKERDFDDAASTTSHRDSGDETKIDVYVRCRGRNEREVRENSGVVVNTDGVKGTTVELSMGSNALSNKTYSFDRVFSPTADQQMIFDEVVMPVLDEVLNGFNCTIFAYGQTGTGKTYTMSGDISDSTLPPDDAGIIPRVLHSLFVKLGSLPNSPISGAAAENSVKVSFIELYNEELRDLLSSEDKSNLRIFDGDSKRGAATVIQGMEERHITNAKNGLQLLRNGSHKRQVAATKCNDLSSRSHTVFTVTVYTKRTLASGEEVVASGKLNLVDLAGSENIGRSGAENKRATEAGLINKSLLTLGRVINALVDQSSHIPYRESKLTRLLQDSLGGRTKTCIIATISPARLNLEETISSLDYAFRAKNIRNKPQINKLISKKTLLKEFTVEIEKLKSELAATRQRNGIYLTHEAHEELTNEAESHRILVKEQREKIETIECKLARKGQDLLDLTSNFARLEDECKATKSNLDSTTSQLEETTVTLAQTRRSLNEETFVRQQHERTEEQLTRLNRELVTTLDQSTTDNTGLHLNLRRRRELHVQNKEQYGGTQRDVVDVTSLVESRLAGFQTQQQGLVDALSGRMHAFVKQELDELHAAKADLETKSTTFDQSHQEVVAQTMQSKDELNQVLNEVKSLRKELKEKVGAGLNDLGVAATRISEGIMSEVESFQTQLHSSYANLLTDFKMTFDDMSQEILEQREDMHRLHEQMATANRQLEQSQSRSVNTLSELVVKEKIARDQENRALLQRMEELIQTNMRQQELRMGEIAQISTQLRTVGQSHAEAGSTFVTGSDQLAERSENLSNKLDVSREAMQTGIQSDMAAASKRTASLKAVTSSVHDETTRIVKEQAQHLDKEMLALDTIVDRIQEQNNTAYAAREQSFSALASTVQDSYANIGGAFALSLERVKGLDNHVAEHANGLCENLQSLDEGMEARSQLTQLRQRVEQDKLQEYVHTGQTPTRREYNYPTAFPRTSDRDTLMERMRTGHTADETSSSRPRSPSKMQMFSDNDIFSGQPPSTSTRAPSLRELDINTLNSPIDSIITSAADNKINSFAASYSSLKRPAAVSSSSESKVPLKKRGTRKTMATSNTSNPMLTENENLMPNFSRSVGHGTMLPTGRSLRSHGRSR